jgi:hypothetical protein
VGWPTDEEGEGGEAGAEDEVDHDLESDSRRVDGLERS